MAKGMEPDARVEAHGLDGRAPHLPSEAVPPQWLAPTVREQEPMSTGRERSEMRRERVEDDLWRAALCAGTLRSWAVPVAGRRR